MEQLEPTQNGEAALKKTPLEPSATLPENQEESPPAVHSEPTTSVSLKAKLANLNLADIKPFYPRSEREREQQRESQEQLERSLYADIASRKHSSLRPISERDEMHPSVPADRIIQMTERELLEEQRRMRQQRGGFSDHSPNLDPNPRRVEEAFRVSPGRYTPTYDVTRSRSHRHLHHATSPMRRPVRPPSGMELLEQNLEHRLNGRDQFFDRPRPDLYRPTASRSVRSSRERSDFDLWADYKKDRTSHYYSSRSSYPALSRTRSKMSISEREHLPSRYSRNMSTTSSFSDYPAAVSRGLPHHASHRTSSRMSTDSSRYQTMDTLDYDLYRYEDLCKSDPVYEDPTQDNEFFMYQMLAAEENAKREKLCGVSAVIPPEQVAKATAPKKETQKSRICRHFLRGHCKFGESCNFFHGAPLVHASDQLVFLGGLPSGITSDILIQELNRSYGVEVLNKPQIFSNFSPRVALSLDDAKLLKGHGKLSIFNRQVDVRAFEDNSKSEAEKCMVFLGGLPEGIKLTELISQLRKKGIQVMNKPYLGDGYARNVQVQSEKHANDLIRKRKIFLFSSSVDVRPYVNVYGKKKDDDNGTVIPVSMLPPRKPTANVTEKTEDDEATSPVTTDTAADATNESAKADKPEEQV